MFAVTTEIAINIAWQPRICLLNEKLSQILLRISGPSEEPLFLELRTSSVSPYSSRD